MLLTVLLCGCERKETVCFSYCHTPMEGWEQHCVLSYKIDTVRQAGDYNMQICLRTTLAYPFRSLWLLVKTQLDNPSMNREDTVTCVLTDKLGHPYGHGLSIYQNDFPMDKIKLARGQYGTITVSHIMRRNILPGISDIGVVVSNSAPYSYAMNEKGLAPF